MPKATLICTKAGYDILLKFVLAWIFYFYFFVLGKCLIEMYLPNLINASVKLEENPLVRVEGPIMSEHLIRYQHFNQVI
jgi:hypothetical protein